MGFWKAIAANAAWQALLELAKALLQQSQDEETVGTSVLAGTFVLLAIVGTVWFVRVALRLMVRLFRSPQFCNWISLAFWAIERLDRFLSMILTALSLLVGGEGRGRDLVRDLRRLQAAQRRYDETGGRDAHASSTIGLLMEKHFDVFTHVSSDPEEQRAATDFCIAALENHPYVTAIEKIQERLQHPFKDPLGHEGGKTMSAKTNEAEIPKPQPLPKEPSAPAQSGIALRPGTDPQIERVRADR